MGEGDRNKLKKYLKRMLGQSSFDHMISNMRDGSEIVVPEGENNN